MNRPAILAATFLAGALSMLLILTARERLAARHAEAHHLAAQASEDSLARRSRAWNDTAAVHAREVVRLKARRVEVVERVEAAPESVAAARGIEVTPDSDGKLCIAPDEFTELLAASESLPLCDSALSASESRADALDSSRVAIGQAYAVAREDAALQASRASKAEERLAAAKRRGWWLAVAGAAAGITATLLLGGGR